MTYPSARLARLPALTLGAVLALAACGGGASSTTPPTLAPSTAQVTSAPAASGPASAVAASPSAAASGAVSPAASAGSGAVAATIANFAFNPPTISVAAGATVTWTNNDDATHTVKFADAESPQLHKGDTYQRTFDKPGTFQYMCGIHPKMMGTVTVR